MPTLVLLRHAKAAPYIVSDAERPLDPRGVEQCKEIGLRLRKWLRKAESVRVSPAARTQETWTRVCQAAEVAPAFSTEPLIYEGSPGALLTVVQQLTGEVGVVVGHNPGMARLAMLLAEDLDAEQLRFLQKFPTGSSALLHADLPWELWQPGAAQLLDLHAPHE